MAETDVKNLKRYGTMAAIAVLPEDPNFKGFALPGLQDFYRTLDTEGDPLIQGAVHRALHETQHSLAMGQGYTGDVAQAIEHYRGKYETAMKASTVAEFVAYSGYSEIPEALNLLIAKYGEKKVGDLDKENPEQKTVLKAIQLLRQNTVGGLMTKLIATGQKTATKAGLESLVGPEAD